MARTGLGAARVAKFSTVAAFSKAERVSVDERIIVVALERLHDEGWLTSSGEPEAGGQLPQADVDFLDAHGGVKDNRDALMKARIASVLRGARVAEDTLTVGEVAEVLGVSESRVRHRLADDTLYSYPSTGRGVPRRIPSWQFEGGRPTPHLAQVLRALPEDFSPVEVRRFVQHARVDHPTRGVEVPLLDWLRDGNDPGPAVELAAAQVLVI